ncbi:MAG: MaoC family dehydratase [Alphaproteobacteria bacterium]|nr:MAG: MaoC family dehydratase [Alphaproteobacteria bacterium]
MRWRETELPEPNLNYEKIMAYRPADIQVSYGERECIIYALGIGIGMDPLDAGELKFVYVQAKLVSRPRVKEIIDKGPGNAAIIQNTRDLLGEDGKPVATVDSSTFARKHGGFGGRMSDTPVPHTVPQTAPELICDLATPPNLALLYRLNGDENPLHADPQRAKAAGFDRPILHGAASFGVAARAILRTYADDQPERLQTIEARFSRPVFPGDTIRTEMWRQGERVSFQCRVVSRNDVVLSNGLATLRM